MRNLKRVLSLALAAIMLMGMMIMGTGAANVGNFNDSDEIQHMEAASIVAGLDIFSGNELGEFDPNGRVTRAMMATIICKILHGSDVNVKIYEGTGKFSDTVGNYAWAEGWTTMCSTLGIVNGYPDGRYGVDDPIRTWQAAYMLERALGYWLPGDPSQGDQLSVMKTASEIGLLGDLDVRANDELNRDQVAEMTFHALFAQQVRWSTDRNNYVKSNDEKVAVVAGTKDPTNTLARNVFGIYVAEGTVVANGMTDELLAGKAGDPGFTTVVFDETADLDQDGRLDYSDYDFSFDTGLDMIGHKADVYYRLNRGTPEVFTIVDKATLVEVIRYDADSTTRLANAANTLGFRRNTILNIDFDDYKINYDLDVTAKIAGYTKAAADDKYIIVISNSGNYEVDEIILLDQDLNQVRSISRTGEYDLYLNSSPKKTVATADFAVKDYVIWTSIGKGGRTSAEARYVIEPATVIDGNISKLTGVTTRRTLITASGVDYEESPVYYYDNNGSTPTLENVIDYQSVRDLGDTTLILDKYDNLVAVAGDPKVKEYVYVAQFGSQHDNSSGKLDTTFGLTADVYLSDGSHRVVFVDYKNSTFKNASWTVVAPGSAGIAADTYSISEATLSNGAAAKFLNGKVNLTSGDNQTITNNDMNHYTWQHDATTTAATGNDKFGFTNGALGIYEAEWKDDNHVSLTAIAGEETGDGTYAGTYQTAFDKDDRFVVGHSTVVRNSGISAVNVNSRVESTKALRQTNGTVYFFVQGVYGSDFSVEVVNDVENLPKNFTVDGTGTTKNANDAAARAAAKPYVVQMFSENVQNSTGYRTVSAALIANVGEEVKSDVYYYNRGNYTVQYNSDRSKVLLTYLAWDKNGNEVELTFEKSSSKNAVEDNANKVPTGYYTEGSNDLKAYAVLGDKDYITGTDRNSTYNGGWDYKAATSTDPHYAYKEGNTMYVVNATLHYETYLNGDTNFFDNVTGIASLVNSAKIIDACNSGLESVVDIKNAFETDDECVITISYDYGKTSLKTGVLYITSYTPASSTGTGKPNPVVKQAWVDYDDPADLQVYSSEADFDDDDAINAIMADLQKKYGATAEISAEAADDTPANMVFSVKSGSVTRKFIYQTSAGSTSAHPDSVFFTLDGNPAATDSGTYSVDQYSYALYRASSTDPWSAEGGDSATGQDITVTNGMEIKTGYVKVTTADETKLTGITKVTSGTGDGCYALATDTVQPLAGATGVGTAFNYGSTTYKEYTENVTFATVAGSTSGTADITVGYVKVTMTGVAADTSVVTVTLGTGASTATLAATGDAAGTAITGKTGYAKVGATDFKVATTVAGSKVTVSGGVTAALTAAGGAADTGNKTVGDTNITVTVAAAD